MNKLPNMSSNQICSGEDGNDSNDTETIMSFTCNHTDTKILTREMVACTLFELCSDRTNRTCASCEGNKNIKYSSESFYRKPSSGKCHVSEKRFPS